jgi:hypothetical protein
MHDAAGRCGSLSFFWIAKRRGKIGNQSLHDGQNRCGLGPICHHESKSFLTVWLLILRAMVIGRLYQLRHLHRCDDGVRSCINVLDSLLVAPGDLSPSRHQLPWAA